MSFKQITTRKKGIIIVPVIILVMVIFSLLFIGIEPKSIVKTKETDTWNTRITTTPDPTVICTECGEDDVFKYTLGVDSVFVNFDIQLTDMKSSSQRVAIYRLQPTNVQIYDNWIMANPSGQDTGSVIQNYNCLRSESLEHRFNLIIVYAGGMYDIEFVIEFAEDDITPTTTTTTPTTTEETTTESLETTVINGTTTVIPKGNGKSSPAFELVLGISIMIIFALNKIRKDRL